MPPVDLTVIAPMLTVFCWATALLLIDLFFIPEDQKRVTGYLAILGFAVAALVAFPLWGTESSTFSGMVVLDSFALILTWIFLLVGAISIAIALDYLPRQEIEQGEFYPLIMFAVGGMLLLAQGANLIVLFLGVELLSITLYILTGFAYPRLTSEEAAMKYLILGAFAAGFFVYGIALIYGQTGTVQLFSVEAGQASIAEYLSRQTFVAADQMLLIAGSGLVLVAFGFKIALVPFHMWTPDVYEGSPTPVAAFMSVGTKGAALAALLRILTLALPELQAIWVPVLSALAVLTMLVGNIGALAQTNVKRMLAYSSVGHAGYILLGILAASDRGAQGFLFYLLAYGLTNLGAFAVLIALEQRGEAAWSLDEFAGLWQRQPYLSIAMAVFMLSLAGVPPTAGFIAKFYVFTAAWEAGLGGLALVGVLTSAIAVFFYLRVIIRMFMHEPVRQIVPPLHRAVTIGIGISVVGTILFGLIPTPIVDLVQRSVIALGS
jgi:NADH-quinone oxidoreductase subunit N